MRIDARCTLKSVVVAGSVKRREPRSVWYRESDRLQLDGLALEDLVDDRLVLLRSERARGVEDGTARAYQPDRLLQERSLGASHVSAKRGRLSGHFPAASPQGAFPGAWRIDQDAVE